MTEESEGSESESATEELTNEDLHTLLLQTEKQLIDKHWLPQFQRPWPIVKRPVGREIKLIPKESIQEMNIELEKINEIAVNEFLLMFGEISITHGIFPHIMKGKMILYQLLSGTSSSCIPGIEYSTFRRIYKAIWMENKKIINDWCNDWMVKLSTPEIRSLYSRLYNPKQFKTVTLFIDSKDFVTVLNDLRSEKRKTKNGKSTIISRKNGWKHGGKIVFLDDIKMNPVCQSRMWGANERYDGKIMQDMKIYEYMDVDLDCLIHDHHFDSEVSNTIEAANAKGIPLSLSNFCSNVKGRSLSNSESDYKDAHSAFRSKQETMRNTMPNIFKAFSCSSKLRVVDFEVKALQINVCNILLAIDREVRRHPAYFKSIICRWKDESFNYPMEEIDYSSPAVSDLLQRSSKMEEKQLTKLLEIKRKFEAEESTSSYINSSEMPIESNVVERRSRGRPKKKVPASTNSISPLRKVIDSPRCSPKKRKQLIRICSKKKRKLF